MPLGHKAPIGIFFKVPQMTLMNSWDGELWTRGEGGEKIEVTGWDLLRLLSQAMF